MSIRFEQITKRYEGNVVVNDVSLEIAGGEFFVLLGPSGSGKSTLLRAVAGLTHIDRGRISLHGRDVTHVPARERGVGFVFQHYALFRHMTVAENIEFALRIRGIGRAERRRRRDELLGLIALEGLGDRLPAQLSGGQQQRVAVARALAHEPEVLLLDEPFGALDAQIRVELRETVRAVQRRLGTTTILVTHDQEEAFALADRIGVMRAGRLLECGTAEDLYRHPASRFTATFLGAANLLLADVTPRGLAIGGALVTRNESLRAPADERREAIAVIRPEDIEVAVDAGAVANHLASGIVRSASFGGQFERLTVELDADSAVRGAGRPSGDAPKGGSAASLRTLEVLRTSNERAALRIDVGQGVELGLRRLHVLPTPVSSMLFASRDGEDPAALREAPLLAQLIRSMHPSIADTDFPTVLQVDSGADRAGLVVVESGEDRIADAARLAARGVRRVLYSRRHQPLPEHVWVQTTSDAARPAVLALVASLVRHVHAEATYVQLQPADAPRGAGTTAFRRLLDARAELKSAYGVDLRTDLKFGDHDRWIGGLASGDSPALLVLGIDGSVDELGAHLAAHYAPLLAPTSSCALLVVYTPRGAVESGAPHAAEAASSTLRR